ncbi:MAG TPA: NAD(P)H-dependent oxidoreductase subunit E, partial [Burkholderiales bacterium]|nr:NAD(P)H-dependent oxidoreductase subunit E [Burkholderiales bacterium]
MSTSHSRKAAVASGRRKVKAAPKGRVMDPRALEEVRALLGDAPRRRDLLIEHLHRIQDRYHHLSDRHLLALAQEMKLAAAEVYEVATFYHHFDVVKDGAEAPPALTVRVCENLACDMAGAKDLMARLPQILGGDVRVIPAPSVGRCEQAPVAVVGRNPVGRATPDAVAQAVKEKRTEAPLPKYLDYRAYRKGGGYRSWLEVWNGTRKPEDVIAALEHSGLRGLGGAGFPVGRKWNIVRAEAEPRLMAVNIDEGEPGTFKDRYYLERDPHRFLEGMLIAAYCVGIAEVYLYLRDEYADCRAILDKEIAALQKNPPSPLPPIHLRRGAGAYICGEES